jgi:hypothetical protein
VDFSSRIAQLTTSAFIAICVVELSMNRLLPRKSFLIPRYTEDAKVYCAARFVLGCEYVD